MPSIAYAAAAEILEAIDEKIRRTGGLVSMRSDDVLGERAMVFEYRSCQIRGEYFTASKVVPWLVLCHMKAPAALGDQVSAEWIAETRRAAERQSQERRTDEN